MTIASLTTVEYVCTHCGEPNETLFDPSGGLDQRYVEDCTVCCHPLVLHVRYDPASDTIVVHAEEES